MCTMCGEVYDEAGCGGGGSGDQGGVVGVGDGGQEKKTLKQTH